MTASLYLLLAISVLFVIVIGAAFWWAIFSGQFDDANEAAHAVLMDDDTPGDNGFAEARDANPSGANQDGANQGGTDSMR